MPGPLNPSPSNNIMKKFHLACLLGIAAILPLNARAATVALPLTTSASQPLDLGAFAGGTSITISFSGHGDVVDASFQVKPDGSLYAPATGNYTFANNGAAYSTQDGGDGVNHLVGGGANFDMTGSGYPFAGKTTTDTTDAAVIRIGAVVGTFSSSPTRADWFFIGKGGTIQVPAGGGHLFVSVNDTVSSDNHGSYTGTVSGAAPGCFPAPAGLISQYSAEGDATDAIGSNNGTLQNGTSFAAGEAGKAFNLAASASNYVSIPDAPSLRPNKLTIEGWVNFNATNLGHALTIFSKATGSSNLNAYVLWYQDGALHASTGNASNYKKLDFAWQPTPGAWYHVAYTFNGTNHSLFVNGVQVATAPNTVVPGYDSHPVLIGADLPGDVNSTPIDFFDGLVDEMSLYSRALSAAEVTSIYNAGQAGKCHATPNCVAAPAGLVSAYSGDGNAADSVGSNEGTLKNGASFGAGKVGQAFKLDGVDDYVAIPYSPSLNPGKMTLEAWINPASIKQGSRIISKDATATSCAPPTVVYSLEVRGEQGNKADFFFTTQDGVFHELVGTSVIPTGAFTHVAATYDGSMARIYVNGVLENSLAASGPIITSDAPTAIGNGGPACRASNAGAIEFHGLIDEVGVYSRALSSAEINGIYDAGSAGKCDAPAHVTVTVPGTANPWLAGAPAGTTASQGNDTLKNAAPVRVPGLELTRGSILTFEATGGTRLDPNYGSSTTPDGLYNMSRGPENGISAVNNVPADSLVGVFLGDAAPGAAPAGLTYDGNIPAGGLNFTSFQPALAQVFFIGDGKNAAGKRQQIIAPAGATRLFLGSMDQYGWYNNGGQFNVTITGGNSDAKNVQLLLGQSASTAIAPNGSAVRPGEIVTYVLNLYNGGTAKATGVTVIDGLPPHMTFVSASNGGHLNAAKQVQFDLGSLAPGQANKQYLTIQARADKDAPLGQPLVNNNYGVFADGVSTIQGRDIISTIVAGPVLVETSTDVSSIAPGGIITYTFTVRNPQNVTAKNVQLSFPLPENAQVDSVNGPGAVVSSTDVTFKLGDVAAGATVKLTVSLQLPYDANPGTAFELAAIKVTSATGSGQIAFFLPPITTKLAAGTTKPPQLGLIKIIPDGVTLRQLAFAAAITGNDLFASFKKVFPAIDSSDGIDALARIVNPDVTDSTNKNGDLVQAVTTPGQTGGPAQTFISYALIYTNGTATAADNTFIQDRVPVGATFVQGSAALDGRSLPAGVLSVLDNGRTLKFSLGTLGATTHLITYKVRVLSPAEGGLAGGDTIQARGTYIATTSLFHTSSAEPEETDVLLRGVPSANIESYKVTANGAVGDIVGYDIFYQNTGTKAATDLRILDPIPAGTSYQRAVLLETLSNGQKKERGVDPSRNEKIDHPAIGSKTGSVTYHLGPVPPGEFGFVRLQVKVEPSAATADGLVYKNKASFAADSFGQTSGATTVTAAGAEPTTAGSLGFDASFYTQNVARVVDPSAPRLGIVAVAPMAVREGDTFQYLLSVANPSPVVCYDIGLYVPLPAGTEFVSAEGQSGQGKTNVSYLGTDPQGRPAVIFPSPRIEKGDNTAPLVDLAAHSAHNYRLTLRAKLGTAGKTLQNGGAQTPITYGGGPTGNEINFRTVYPAYCPGFSTYVYGQNQSFESARRDIVTSSLAAQGLNSPVTTDRAGFEGSITALSPKATTVVQGGLDNVQLNNGAILAPLGDGNALAAGPQSGLIASGGGNVVSNDGGSLIAAGGGNLIKVTNLLANDGSKLIGQDGAGITSILSNLVAAGGGNLIAAGGGNLVAAGGGNLITQDGAGLISNDGAGVTALNSSNLVAAGGGNLVAAGGGNLIASGGGNLIASGGGNLVAAGGGNLVAAGGGNLVAAGGGNLIASGGGNFTSSDGSRALLMTTNGLVAAGGGNLVASGGGN